MLYSTSLTLLVLEDVRLTFQSCSCDVSDTLAAREFSLLAYAVFIRVDLYLNYLIWTIWYIQSSENRASTTDLDQRSLKWFWLIEPLLLFQRSCNGFAGLHLTLSGNLQECSSLSKHTAWEEINLCFHRFTFIPFTLIKILKYKESINQNASMSSPPPYVFYAWATPPNQRDGTSYIRNWFIRLSKGKNLKLLNQEVVPGTCI